MSLAERDEIAGGDVEFGAERIVLRDAHAAATTELEQPGVAQSAVAGEHRVAVDVQGLGEFLGRRQPVARAQFASRQSAPHARRDLVLQRARSTGGRRSITWCQ